jgi:hypothetical protein
MHLSLWAAGLLNLAYGGGLVFTFTSRRDPFGASAPWRPEASVSG